MFKFKLASVLSLKEKIEDSKKRELGEAAIQAEVIRNEKNQMIAEKKAAMQDIVEQNKSAINIQDFKVFNQYNAHMEKALKEKEQQVIAAEQKVEEKRKQLLEAVKERKILDNLKAIQEESAKEEEKRAEQSILDDMVTYKYGNRGKE